MSCTTWNESLIGRLYGEIEADDDAALDVHLASCASCRETLDELRSVRTLLRENEPVTPRATGGRPPRPHEVPPALLGARRSSATAILAGAGVGAGYARWVPGRPCCPNPRSRPPRRQPRRLRRKELVRREVDRRLATLSEARAASHRPVGRRHGRRFVRPSVPSPRKPSGRSSPSSSADSTARAPRISNTFSIRSPRPSSASGPASERRIEALRSVALASNPYVNEQ